MFWIHSGQSVRLAFMSKCKVRGIKIVPFFNQMNDGTTYEGIGCDQKEQMTIDAYSKPPRRAPFARGLRGSFFQESPSLDNVFKGDSSLKDYLEKIVPEEILKIITLDLKQFGHRVSDEIDQLGRECETNPPTLETIDAWGYRNDKLTTCHAWKQQKIIAAEEGLVAIPYEQKYGPFSRVYWVAKMLMYCPSSGLFSCPLAMTDGAAKFFQVHGNKFKAIRDRAFPCLVTRDGNKCWTSGQWMTERRGGSDVADGTETVAVKEKDGSYKLYGYKWFSSASDSDMTLTLARILDKDGNYTKGTKGLSLFYVETRDKDDQLNGMELQKLKSKLGTRQLPTAEILLDGTIAHLVSDEGLGIAAIIPMLTISRIHNAVSSVGVMRRIVHLARDYSQKRHAFGKMIGGHPLHMQTLCRMEIETRGNMMLVLHLSYLLGLEECGLATEQDLQLLRVITPIAKLYTAKQAIAITSEGLECFGGQGYIEDTGLPSMLRDAQVLSIWEGTTNILALDMIRSMVKSSGGSLTTLLTDIKIRINPFAEASHPSIRWCHEEINKACSCISSFVDSAGKNQELMSVAARDFAYSLARMYIGSLLLEHAAWRKAKEHDIVILKRWCEQCLCLVGQLGASGEYTQEAMRNNTAIVMDGYDDSHI